MALRAGYYGIKRFLRDKLDTIAGTYDETIKSLFPRSEQAVLGAKNFLDNTAITTTKNGVTFTVNSDNSVSTSGTSDAEWVRFDLNRFVIPKGDYILSGITGGKSSTYRLGIQKHVSGSIDEIVYDGEVNIHFDTDTDITVYITIRQSDVNMDGKVFYPMLRLATDTDSTYASYAMTNRELTDSASDQKTAINAIITAVTGAADFAAFKTAMGAITPVTRSLSLTKEDITEEVKEDVEPEKTVTKKRTTKKIEEV